MPKSCKALQDRAQGNFNAHKDAEKTVHPTELL